MLLSLPGPEGPHVAVLVPLLKDHCYSRVPGLICEVSVSITLFPSLREYCAGFVLPEGIKSWKVLNL